jgi:tryptophan synthase alpha chain
VTNRIDAKFAELRAKSRKAFIPYVSAGDPDLDTTVDIVLALEEAGADLVELGVPYSDPLADGPVIQDAFSRVLARGFRVADTWEIVRRIRLRSQLPLLTMVSYSLVYRYGAERYVSEALAAGVDGAVIPDLGVEEGKDFLDQAAASHFATVLLVAPTTDPVRERAIVQRSTGFLYCISVVGITGERATLPPQLRDHVERLKKLTTKPVCVGFGVSTPEHVKIVASVADGVIVGSAIVKLISSHSAPKKGSRTLFTSAYKRPNGQTEPHGKKRIDSFSPADRAKLLADLSRFVRELTAPLR